MANLTKQKRLTYQAQLESMGVRLGRMEREYGSHKARERTDDIFLALRDMDAQQNCRRYKWLGLPPNLFGWLIEQMLYTKGSLVGFFNGGELKILPYTQTGGINLYGLPNKVQPISYNGLVISANNSQEAEKKQGIELMVNNYGGHQKDAKAVILYDRIPAMSQNAQPLSRLALNQVFLEFQAEIITRIRINITNATMKLVFKAKNEKQKNQMTQDVNEALGTGSPVVIMVDGDALSASDGKPLQSGVELETQELFQAWQSLNSIRCMLSGIKNDGAFEKKERQLTTETMNDEAQTQIVADVGLDMRRLFIEQLKMQYPEYADILKNMRVELADALEYTQGGQEQTDEKKEGDADGDTDNQ